MVKFSILIAYYNKLKYFLDCYNSINQQTYKNIEIIIVDDCSSIEEYDALKVIIKDDARVKLYKNEKNRGVGYTKKKLVEYATGEICGFIDPDDTIIASAIEIMVKAHSENPLASIINSNLNFCDENLKVISSSNVRQVAQNNPLFFNFNGDISHFATFKKSYYNQTEGIDTYFKIAEDQDIYLKLYEVGQSLQIEEVLYFYRLNNDSLTNVNNNETVLYWHWIAAIFSSKRRNINIENLFVESFVNRKPYSIFENKLNLIKQSRLLKLLNKLGLFKAYKYL